MDSPGGWFVFEGKQTGHDNEEIHGPKHARIVIVIAGIGIGPIVANVRDCEYPTHLRLRVQEFFAALPMRLDVRDDVLQVGNGRHDVLFA